MFKSTVYTVLGMLAMKPMSGYEIKKSIDESTHFFWNESPGQIYPALKCAQENNLISSKQQKGTRNKTTYRITDAGRKELREWLSHAPEKFTQRNELLLKVFFGNNTDQKVILNYLHESLHQMQIKLRLYKEIEAMTQQHLKDKTDGAKYWHITIQFGLRSLQASIDWAKDSIRFLEMN